MLAILRTHRPARAPMHRRATARRAPATRHIVTLALALLAAALLLLSRTATGAEVALTVNVAPPPLPVYEQPPLPSPGCLWVPGYWSWQPDEGYFWVPGTWVLPPDPDLVWTPGYWGFANDAYVWYPGYWAPQVGFYGGIVYGYGYFGHGYEGGYWRDHHFWYNRSVNNIGNTSVTNVYNKTVNNVTVNNISYNGPGGVSARPSAEEAAAARQPRHAPSREQVAQVSAASHQHELLASVNQGHPPIAATPKPGEFSGSGATPARLASRGAGTGAAANGHSGQAPAGTAPPPESRARPELGPNEQAQVQRPAPPATPPPPERAPSKAQAPQHEAPQHERAPRSQSREPGKHPEEPPH